mgnify:CR=1 FL=1
MFEALFDRVTTPPPLPPFWDGFAVYKQQSVSSKFILIYNFVGIGYHSRSNSSKMSSEQEINKKITGKCEIIQARHFILVRSQYCYNNQISNNRRVF